MIDYPKLQEIARKEGLVALPAEGLMKLIRVTSFATNVLESLDNKNDEEILKWLNELERELIWLGARQPRFPRDGDDPLWASEEEKDIEWP